MQCKEIEVVSDDGDDDDDMQALEVRGGTTSCSVRCQQSDVQLLRLQDNVSITTSPLVLTPCGLRGCKNRPALFPSRMSVSEMTYTVSSGMLNSTILYHSWPDVVKGN